MDKPSSLVPTGAGQPARRRRGTDKAVPHVTLGRAHVSRQLSRRLPYYLTHDEAHQLVEAAETERDRLFLRLLWETGLLVSEAVALVIENVGRDGMRVLGKGNVERVVYIQHGLVSAILFHAQEQGLERHDFLFPSRKGATLPSRGPTRS